MTPSEPQTNVAGGPLLEPHDDGCRCWPHVSQSDAFRAVEHAALLEYRASKPVEREAQGIPLIDVELLGRAIEEVTEEWDDTDSQPSVIFAGSQYDLRERIAAEYTRLLPESSPIEKPEQPEAVK